MKHILFGLVLAGLIATSLATYGLDVSLLTPSSSWECLRGRGFSFAAVRAYRSSGSFDSHAAANIERARAAGFDPIDVYLFPCPRCSKSATTQVQETVDGLRQAGASYRKLWLDVEAAQLWHSVTYNRDWILEAVRAAKDLGQDVGIYTSSYQWSSVVGSWGPEETSSLDLWYAHYDHSPSLSDFRAFGGWTKPSIKQYYGDAFECGVGLDKNWS